MYALSFSSYRLVRNLSTPQISIISKITYRELTNNANRMTLTSSVYNYNEDLLAQRKQLLQEIRKLSVDVKQEGADQQHPPPPQQPGPQEHQQRDVVVEVRKLLQSVKFSDLSGAPQPAFWLGIASLVPFALPVVSSILFGYSHFLATAELAYGATICSYLGGMKWGYSIDDKSTHKPTWENLGYAVVPQCVAWFGLLLPQTLGFVVVGLGLLVSAYIDLTTVQYPTWFRAMRLCFTPIAVVLLLFASLMRLVH